MKELMSESSFTSSHRLRKLAQGWVLPLSVLLQLSNQVKFSRLTSNTSHSQNSQKLNSWNRSIVLSIHSSLNKSHNHPTSKANQPSPQRSQNYSQPPLKASSTQTSHSQTPASTHLPPKPSASNSPAAYPHSRPQTLSPSPQPHPSSPTAPPSPHQSTPRAIPSPSLRPQQRASIADECRARVQKRRG